MCVSHCVQLFVTLGTVAHQAPPSMGFSRQEYWSGLPCPSPEDLPNPGIDPVLPYCGQILYHLSQLGNPWNMMHLNNVKTSKQSISSTSRCSSFSFFKNQQQKLMQHCKAILKCKQINKNHTHNPQSCHIPVVLNFDIHIRIIQENKMWFSIYWAVFTTYLKLYVSESGKISQILIYIWKIYE